jgi:hypothetical protein
MEFVVGSSAPSGQEGRRIKTARLAQIRIYGPERAAFDKNWKPGDLVEIKWRLVLVIAGCDVNFGVQIPTSTADKAGNKEAMGLATRECPPSLLS